MLRFPLCCRLNFRASTWFWAEQLCRYIYIDISWSIMSFLSCLLKADSFRTSEPARLHHGQAALWCLLSQCWSKRDKVCRSRSWVPESWLWHESWCSPLAATVCFSLLTQSWDVVSCYQLRAKSATALRWARKYLLDLWTTSWISAKETREVPADRLLWGHV